MDFLPDVARYHRMNMFSYIGPALQVGLLVVLAWAVPAQAQLGGPRLGTPRLPTLPDLSRVPLEPRLPLQQTVDATLSAIPAPPLRLNTVRDLLRKHPDLLEADPLGEPIRKAELVLLSPAPGLVDATLALGFTLLRERNLPELDLYQVVLRPPQGRTTAAALAQLRALQPDVEADFNHIYTTSGESNAADGLGKRRANGPVRVGLIDGGLDRQHPALQRAELQVWGCSGAQVASAHGTAVAALLVGRSGTAAAQRSVLYAADIYCAQPTGGAAEDVAGALAWMARERVAVVNISLVGPANRMLERSVQALIRKGHIVVAAVGNDGPAAAPLYPAAYAGVVAVTGVAKSQRVLPEAAQGPHVMFAALGMQRNAAQLGGGSTSVRGTSFAAPHVAVLLAQQLPQPDPVAAQAAVAYLAAGALDLGAPGRDPVYGWGLVDIDKP